MGLSNNSKDRNDILQFLENSKARDSLIESNSEVLKAIGVFVLLRSAPPRCIIPPMANRATVFLKTFGWPLSTL